MRALLVLPFRWEGFEGLRGRDRDVPALILFGALAFPRVLSSDDPVLRQGRSARILY